MQGRSAKGNPDGVVFFREDIGNSDLLFTAWDEKGNRVDELLGSVVSIFSICLGTT